MIFTADVLLDRYFETAFSAPDGIKRLRELILTLAMQGKLVPQDPSDQSAGELLKEIEAEKQALIKAGKIKKQKPLPEITAEEIPYELPESWEWVRLIELGFWATGSGFSNNIQGDTSQEILMCKVSDMNIIGNEKFIRIANNTISEELALQKKTNIHEPNTIIFPKIGGAIATNKRRILIKRTAIDNNCLGIKPHKKIYIEWMYKLLESFDFSQYQSGTSVPAISQGTIGLIVLGLPPIAQQKRIVEKVDRLMAQCDQLEQLQREREQKRILIHTAAREKLLKASDQETFGQAWDFIKENFGDLYAVKENVTSLRQAILQLAVMGKLVPQDPGDPPASHLLKEIEVEKQRLIKEGKLKKQKPLPEITADEIPYDLPDSWEWVRLGSLFRVTSGTNLTKEKMKDGKIPVYGGNGVTGYHDEFNTEKSTIVIGRVGYYCGSIHLTPEKAWVTDNAFFTIYDEERIYQNFVIWLFKTINLQTDKSATAQPVISGSKIYPILIPLPPLPEQHRIVAKVDALMTLCDRLETQIDQQNAKQTQLLESVMAEF
ncbi:restriction endonuclease subunit S [Synechocystis sp. PCC 7339]|uniref:restriction endonuclease subunit S n=1 Tax=Synechocystis sp. PCC 7339 TaxID=2782213 RepID=UPI001CBCC441|nr:restriction endonuclease subunit S [Synechocystis sp. PCC 7339]UAJ72737.1 restriction endonuclease subunit S [Synechocystis sp. PCC 7339]